MKVIKRDGHMVDWCPEKIEQAIMKANNEVEEEEQASSTQIKNIIKYLPNIPLAVVPKIPTIHLTNLSAIYLSPILF